MATRERELVALLASIEEETPVHEQEAFLYAIFNELQGLFPSLVFTLSQVHDSAKSVPVLQIIQCQLFNHAPFGAVSRVQAAVYYKSYIVHVLMRQWKPSRFEIRKKSGTFAILWRRSQNTIFVQVLNEIITTRSIML